MRFAVLFPGQGSQYVGMGSDLFDESNGTPVRSDLLGAPADDVLGWSLQDLCQNGPEDLLTSTDRAQPALFAVSYALWDAFRMEAGRMPAAAAGHSLGEYTALAAAGAIDYLDGLALVAERGRAMAAAANSADDSTMAAVIGSPDDVVEAVLEARRSEGGQIWAANFNAPGQLVVAGSTVDVDWLVAEAKRLGLRRVIPLSVAAAFHSPFMASAAAALTDAVAAVSFNEPAFEVYANVAAAPVSDIGDSLISQLTSPVRFVETLETMAAAGIDTFVHIGPGDVTAGLVRKTIPGATVAVVDTLAGIDSAARIVNEEGGADA